MQSIRINVNIINNVKRGKSVNIRNDVLGYNIIHFKLITN